MNELRDEIADAIAPEWKPLRGGCVVYPVVREEAADRVLALLRSRCLLVEDWDGLARAMASAAWGLAGAGTSAAGPGWEKDDPSKPPGWVLELNRRYFAELLRMVRFDRGEGGGEPA